MVPIFNVPGITGDLKFTGPLLANLFLGTVKKWDDPAIATPNPGVKPPATDITVVHRSDFMVSARDVRHHAPEVGQ